jgi:Uma2 family endonuclease
MPLRIHSYILRSSAISAAVIGSRQEMASALVLPISEEEYLHTSYSPDCDFVDGLVLERTLGQFDHSNLQRLLVGLFFLNEKKWAVLGLPEQRLRIRTGKYRVPDLLVVPLDYDRSPIVVVAPLLCIEILSPDDRMPRILERCWEYNEIGVPESWIFDPETKKAFIAKDHAVTVAPDLLRCRQIEISCADLFARI